MAKKYTENGVDIEVSDSGVRTERHPSGHTVEHSSNTGITTERSPSGRISRSGVHRGAVHSIGGRKPTGYGNGYYNIGTMASEMREKYEEKHDYYPDEFLVEILDLENNRKKLLMKHKHRTIRGKTYYCFVNSVTKQEEWFYCPKPKKVSIKHCKGKAQIEYIGLTKMSQPKNGEFTLGEWAEETPIVISEKGYQETDVVCLYRVDISTKGINDPVIDYSEPYLAHVGQEYAVPFSSSEELYCGEKRFLYLNHGLQISDDGKFVRKGVEHAITLKNKKARFAEYSVADLTRTDSSKQAENYTVRDVVQERKQEEIETQIKKEINENHQKTKIENDPKIELMRTEFERKHMKGQPEFFLIENPATGEKKWYYCPQATLFVDRNPKTKKTAKHVSLGVVSPDLSIDDGKVSMSQATYNSTDIVMLYEVDVQKGKKPVINRNKFYVTHLETLEMVECSGSSRVYISDDGEKMKVLNPFAPNMRYDEYSTRTNSLLDTYVDAP